MVCVVLRVLLLWVVVALTFDLALAGVCCTCTDTWPCDVTVEVMCDVAVFADALPLLLLIVLLLLGTDGIVMVVGVLGNNWNTAGAVAGMVARAAAGDVLNCWEVVSTAIDLVAVVAASAEACVVF